ncbi:MAG: hypothetical protein ACRYHA_00640 [Janthinobacterium lividum]
MRDSCIPASSAAWAAQDPVLFDALHHIGILRLIDLLDARSLRDWLTLRCFLDAARSWPRILPFPADALARWATHDLHDRYDIPLLPAHPTFESRHLLAQLTAALTAQADANVTPALGDVVATRVRRNFLASRKRFAKRAMTLDALDAVLRTLTADFARLAAMPPDAAPCAEAFAQSAPGIDAIDESRNAAELFAAWRATLRWADETVYTVPEGPVDIVSKMRRGDVRVVRESPNEAHARLEVTFPTQPPRTLEVALPRSLARRLPAFCNPLGPLEHDALRAALRHLPACRAVLDDDARRARLYWSAAARYAHAPPRRGVRHRARSWRATALRAMVLASAWHGGPSPTTRREEAGLHVGTGAWLAASWSACQQWWWHSTAFSRAMAHAATARDAGSQAFGTPGTFDEADGADEADEADGADEADEADEADGAKETDGANGADEADDLDADDRTDTSKRTGTGEPPSRASAARTWDDDEVTLLWEHVSPDVRRQIVGGARRFAHYPHEADRWEDSRDDAAIRRLNDEGWYAYSNMPAIFFLCEALLDARHVVNQTAFHALLGDIARATAQHRATQVLCFEDERNQALAWRVNTTAAPGADVVPIATALTGPRRRSKARPNADRTERNATAALPTGTTPNPSPNASPSAPPSASPSATLHALPPPSPDATRSDAGRRLVLKQILALLAKTNDPPFDLDTLLYAMIQIKHEYDTNITAHAEQPVAEVRSAIRRAALTRLVDINRREFPRRIAPGELATPGALRFADLLLGFLDPVLLAAPDTLAYGGAEMFHARFGTYFAERNGASGMTSDLWAPLVSRGREYVQGWCVLARDERYLAAMNAENPILVRHLQSLFSIEITRGTWFFNFLRIGPPPARSTIANQYLLEAGIAPEHRIEFRKFITLNEAQTNHALLRQFDNRTLLEVYMAIDDGLQRLREAEPRYAAVLPHSALARLPSRRDVISQFNQAYDDKMKDLRRFTRETIDAGFAVCAASIKRDFATATRLKLHLYRPIAVEKSLIAHYVGLLDEDTHRYKRKILGYSTGAIIETIGSTGQSWFYLFDVQRFMTGNRTTMLTPLPELHDARDVERYMDSFPDQFFVELFASVYDAEPVYFKDDVEPYLHYECDGLDGVWEKWNDYRVSHYAWRKRVAFEQIGVEEIQDDPLSLYVEMLPFYPCEAARQARALTLSAILDGIFCVVDLSGLRHVLKPMRTWIAHSAAVARIKKELAWYESLRKRPSLDASVIGKQIAALRSTQSSLDELRLSRSTRDVALAFRKIGHFPFSDSASIAYRLYHAGHTMVDIGTRIQFFANEKRESPMQRFLRWQKRTTLWENDPQNRPFEEERSRRSRTIVGDLRHASEQALAHRLRGATCSPHVCVSTCRFASLASMSARRRMRIFVKVLDGVSSRDIVRQSARQGVLPTSDMLSELTQIAVDLAPLREMFIRVHEWHPAPPARRRAMLSQALLHPFANTTENAHLSTLAAYRELAGNLSALNFFFESPLQQWVRTLDPPRAPTPPCRPPRHNQTAPDGCDTRLASRADARAAPRAPLTSATVSVRKDKGTCTRPGEDNEIRTCLLPIPHCTDQRSRPAPAADDAGEADAADGAGAAAAAKGAVLRP